MCNLRCMGKRSSFAVMMCLTTSFFFVEIIVGYMTNSMALVADSFHMLSDILSLIIGYFALKYSRKSPGTSIEANTYGYVRAEVLGALINAVFLLALCFSIFVESFKRMIELDTIKNPILVLIVGGAGLFINIVGLFLFQGHAHSHGGHTHGSHGSHGHSHGSHGHGSHGHSHEKKKKKKALPSPDNDKKDTNDSVVSHRFYNKAYRRDSEDINLPYEKNNTFTTIDLGPPALVTIPEEVNPDTPSKPKKEKSGAQMNMKGVYLHILGDALGSVIVIIAALVIHFFKGKWTLYVDPGLSIVIVVIILKTTIPLLLESSKILLQYAPSHIQLNKLQEKMLVKFPVIQNIHEFHVWQLTGNKIIASVHVRFSTYADYERLAASMKEFFHDEGIHSTTIQPEFKEDIESSDELCLLSCVEQSCEEKLCCRRLKKSSRKSKKNKQEKKSPCDKDNSSICSENSDDVISDSSSAHSSPCMKENKDRNVETSVHAHPTVTFLEQTSADNTKL